MEKPFGPGINRLGLVFAVTIISVSFASSCFAAVPAANTDNNGRIVTGGVYYNTPGNRTTFRNRGAGGLWVRSGSTVRGLEMDPNGNPTNHGGTLHFYAPGSVVRVDGKIDVNALRNAQGAPLGNGGKVFVDADYLYQSGQIFANGRNGGLVQINVAGATLTPGVVIQAKGEGGNGGVVAMNASGIIDLQNQSLIDTSGRVSANFDTNIINIEGGIVNIEGRIKADGVEPVFGGSRGGTIRLVAGSYVDTDTMTRAWGDETSVLTATQREQLTARLDELYLGFHPPINHLRIYQNLSSPVNAVITANGTQGIPDASNNPTGLLRAGDGGTILMASQENIENANGLIQANGASGSSGAQPVRGGNGGTIVLLANGEVINQPQGHFETNGGRSGSTFSPVAGAAGGDGGAIVISAKSGFRNAGQVSANGAKGGDRPNPGRGGQGGLIVLNLLSNPTQNGLLEANAGEGGNEGNALLGGKAGTIVSWDPATLQQNQRYTQRGYANGTSVLNPATEKSQPFELVTHAENAIIMAGDNHGQPYDYGIIQNLFNRFSIARIRSVADPTGTLGLARNEFIQKNTPNNLYYYRNLLSANVWPAGVVLDMAPPITPDAFGLDVSRYFRKLNSLTIVDPSGVNTNNQLYQVPADFWVLGRNRSIFGGGRVSILSPFAELYDPIGATGLASGGSVHIEAGAIYGSVGLFTRSSLHGGSLMLKSFSGDSLSETGYITLGGRFSVDSSPRTITASQGGALGGVVRILSPGEIFYNIGHDVIANGGLQGGILAAHAGNNFYGNGDSKFQANGGQGNGGFIRIQAGNNLVHSGLIEANGLLSGGTIALTAGDDVAGTYPRFGLNPSYSRSQIPAFLIPGPLTPPLSKVTTGRYNDAEETLFNFGGIRALGGEQNGKVYLAGNNQILLYEGSFLNNVRMNVSTVAGSANPNQAFQSSLSGLNAKAGHVYAVTGQRITGWLGDTRTASSAVLEAVREGTEPDVNPQVQYQGSELPDDFFFEPAHSQP